MGLPLFKLAVLALWATTAKCRVAQRDLAYENSSEPIESCYGPSPRCYDSIRGYKIETLEEARSVMANRQVLAQLAADIEAAASCMRVGASTPACQRFDFPEISIYELTAAYLRSSGGIDHIVALSSSKCLKDYDKLHQTYAAYVQCRTDVREALAFPNPGPGNYQYFESPQFQHCLAERGRMLCGKAAETFVNSAVELARSSPAGREVIAEVFSE